MGTETAARPLEVAIAAGGTAGHINPALALAEELRARGHHVWFFGQQRRLEGKLVPEAGFDFFPIEVSGFDRQRPWTAITALRKSHAAERAIAEHYQANPAPDVAVGFGAYVEVPLLRWCSSKGIPCVIHEQNSVAGLANRMMAGKCARVCIALPAARDAFSGKVDADRIRVTGNPVRRQIIDASRERGRDELGATADDVVVLVFGGSLGAHHVNEAIISLKDELLSRPAVRVVHSTGAEDNEWATEQLALTADETRRWDVRAYIDDMGDMLAAADLVVSRAGASSIAEIAASCVPSVLVPYPFATGDHQTTNARYLVDVGAAELVADDALDTPAFPEAVLGLVDDAGRREEMREACRGLGSAHAAEVLAEQVEDAAARR